jgi:hypothetical protein
VILQLSLTAVREQAKAAARSAASAGSSAAPVLTLTSPGGDLVTWPLVDVLTHIDRADVVRWDGDELVVLVRGDYPRRLCLRAPAANSGAHTNVPSPCASQEAVASAAAWEVDDADGTVIYRGRDLELADELYGLQAPGAHLVPLAGPVS